MFELNIEEVERWALNQKDYGARPLNNFILVRKQDWNEKMIIN